MQNNPNRHEESRRLIRRAIRARKDHRITGWDYSGVEVNISCCYHQDKKMIDYVEKDGNMHGDCASMCFIVPPDQCTKASGKYGKELRQSGKNAFVFPQFYFQRYENTAQGLWNQALDIPLRLPSDPEKTIIQHLKDKNIRNYDAFERHIKNVVSEFWDCMFPDFGKWRNKHIDDYNKKGYIDLLTGFRIEGVLTQYQLANFPIQGPAFHCLLWSFTQIHKKFKAEYWKSKLIGQIHDEALVDVHETEREKALREVTKIMSIDLRKHWDWIIVPMRVEADETELGGTWFKKSGIKNLEEYLKS